MHAITHINRSLRRFPYSFIKLDQKHEPASHLITRQICNYSDSRYSKSQNYSLICSGIPTSKRFIHTNKVNYEREHVMKSESASYEGSGKTTVTILNEEVQFIMIDSVGLSGFRLNTGLKAYGPMAVFPNAVLSWKVMDFLQVNERALSIFTIIEPKPDIVIIGYGDRPNTAIRKPRIDYDIDDEREEKMENEYRLVEKRNKEVAVHCAKLALTMRQKKINLECMPTEDACAAYNYLVSEDRLVAAALIPPNHVQRSSYDQEVTSKLAHGDDPWHFTRNQMFNMSDERHFRDIEPVRKLKEAFTNQDDKIKSDDK